MDQYEINNVIESLSKTIEDLTYRVYRLEDSIASLSAHIEERKGEHIDA